MGKNLYIPFWMSTAFCCASWLVAFLVEEQKSKHDSQQYVPIAGTGYGTLAPAVQVSQQDSPIAPGSPAWSVQSPTLQDAPLTRSTWTKLKIREIASLFHGPASYFCLTNFFFKRIAFASENYVSQYASEKFGWPLHRTSWLKSATAVGAVSATLIACPLVTSFLLHKGFAPHRLDIGIIRVSLLTVMAAFFSAWKASSASLLALGRLSIFHNERCAFG